jgi:hypothetical protein
MVLLSALLSGSMKMFELVKNLYNNPPITFAIMCFISSKFHYYMNDRLDIYGILLNKLNNRDYCHLLDTARVSTQLIIYLLEDGYEIPSGTIKSRIRKLDEKIQYLVDVDLPHRKEDEQLEKLTAFIKK